MYKMTSYYDSEAEKYYWEREHQRKVRRTDMINLASLNAVIESQFEGYRDTLVEVVEAHIVLRSAAQALQISVGPQGLTLVPLETQQEEVDKPRFVRGQPVDEEVS